MSRSSLSRSSLITDHKSLKVQTSFESGHQGMINDAKMDYCGSKLATAGEDKTVRIFSIDHNTGACHKLAELTGYDGPVWQLAWSHPKFGPLLASASYDGRVIIWKEATTNTADKSLWKAKFDKQLHKSSVNSVSWAAPKFGVILAAGSCDGSISILTQEEGKEDDWSAGKIAKAHELGCYALSWSHTDKRFASGGNDFHVKIWSCNNDQHEWVLENTLRGHQDWIYGVEWSPIEDAVVSSARDGKVLIWTKSEEPEIPEWNHSQSFVNINVSCNESSELWTPSILQASDSAKLFDVSWDPMGTFLCVAVAGKDNQINIWKKNHAGVWKQVSDSTKPLTSTPRASVIVKGSFSFENTVNEN